MADKKLNEVTTVNSGTLANVKNFLAVMNDGSIQQMSKADLASVVGGLLAISHQNRIDCTGKTISQIKNNILEIVKETSSSMTFYNKYTSLYIYLSAGSNCIQNWNNDEYIIQTGVAAVIIIDCIVVASGNTYFSFSILSYGTNSFLKGIVGNDEWRNSKIL